MTVFANSLEISAKAQSCKVIAAFPDTCFTPPQTQVTPPGVPLPYPNFSQDSDLSSGSTSVKIKNKPISQENKSKYSKCTGDEAGSAPKKGIVTSNNKGKVYAQKWSMNVKVQGKGPVRFSDIATSNHRSNPGDTPPMVVVGRPTPPGILADDENCLVGGYDEIQKKCNERGGQAHHIIPDEYIRTGTRDVSVPAHPSFPEIGDACAVCVGGSAAGKASSERQSSEGKAVAAKGQAHTANTGARPIHDGRGHGYMHYFFDATFGNNVRPIGDAVTIAKQALTNLGNYDSSVVDPACAEKGKECIDSQFSTACNLNPQPTCKANVNKSNERFDNMKERLSREGNLNSNLMPTRHSSIV